MGFATSPVKNALISKGSIWVGSKTAGVTMLRWAEGSFRMAKRWDTCSRRNFMNLCPSVVPDRLDGRWFGPQ